jgi:ribosomal protein S18 acetylase RimI-like enzyme
LNTPRPLTQGEHALIGNIIGDSFSDDPVNLWVFGGQQSITAYNILAAKKLYLRRGFGHVVADDGGTLWLPPGTSKHIPLWNSLDIATTMLRYGGIQSLRRGLTVDNFLSRKKPKEPHYYLYAIGARRARQGKGVGGALMSAGLERADRDHMPAYLESSKEINVPFYRRFGFEVIEQVTPVPGCPPLWLMWRAPR